MRGMINAAIGLVLMLFAGFIYAWSILSVPIATEFSQWTGTQLSLTFTICMACFCLGGILSGVLARRVPIRVNLLLSAILFVVGFFITGHITGISMLYLGYGVLGGTASGLAYNSVLGVVPQWFPTKQGLISGMLLMGFGASSLLIGTAFSALTPDGVGAWRTSVQVMGALMGALLLVGALVLRLPKGGELPAAAEAINKVSAEYTTAEMLRKGSFWLFFLWSVFLSAAGLVVIGQARAMALAANPQMEVSALTLAVGLISVCNGLGRVTFGGLYDRLGHRVTMLLVNLSLLMGVGLLLLSLGGAGGLLVPGFVMVGLGYGGTPTMNASVTKSFFGLRHYPVNFSVMNMGLLVASFAATAAGAIYDAVGGFQPVFLLLFALLGVGLFSALVLRKPQSQERAQRKRC